MTKTDIAPTAAFAARWWRDQLDTPQDQNQNADLGNPMFTAIAMLGYRNIGKDNLDRFEAALAAEIQNADGFETEYGVAVEVDYHPSRVLVNAATKAEVDLGMQLPFKTWMRVSHTRVTLAGYQTEPETLFEMSAEEEKK